MRTPALIVAGFLLLTLLVAPAVAADDEPRWPREFTFEDGATLVVYQPQVEAWKDFDDLTARVAFRVCLSKTAEPVLGAMRLTAHTAINHADRSVVLSGFQLSDFSFPSLDTARAAEAEIVVRRCLPSDPVSVEMDRLVANMEHKLPMERDVKLSTDPPELIVSREPAVLVLLDGEPVLERVGDTGLMVVVNTESELLFDPKGGRYFLQVDASWLAASALDGAWAPAGELPAGFKALPDDERWTETRKHVPGKPLKPEDAPVVYVRDKPTELLVSDGEPRFQPIPGTRLLAVTNTEADVFLNSANGLYYVLLSGRWYETEGRDRPLTYCGERLSEDFAKIPAENQAGRVLANVPGTPQAEEAAIESQIPRRATLKRGEATVEVSYDGKNPIFQPVVGAGGVQKAVNTSFQVFLVQGRYYVCYRAAWFISDGPKGPWALCDEVPEEIYSIPPKDSSYVVTYVYPERSDEDSVTYAYWPGYYGVYYSGGTVWYGTGYWYRYRPAYYRHYYHCRRWHHWHHCHGRRTWGRAVHYDHMSGYYRRGAHARRHHYARHHSVNAYRHWNARAVRADRYSQAWKTSAGRYAGAAAVKGDRYAGAAAVKGDRYKGAAEVKGDRTRGAAGAGSGWNRGRAPKKGFGDMYAGKSGGVYRRQNGLWQKYENGRWYTTNLNDPKAAQAHRPGSGQARRPGSGQASRPGTQPGARPGTRPATRPANRKATRPANRQARTNRRPPARYRAPKRQPRRNHDLNRSHRARNEGANRRRSYNNYRSSRQSQARSRPAQRSGGGARGGGRGGGGRR